MPSQALPYTIKSCTTSTPTGIPQNILTETKAAYWTTGSGKNHQLILELKETALVSTIEIQNKGVTKIAIFNSLTNAKHSYIPVLRQSIPMNRKSSLNLSSLPTRFIKILCEEGNPCSIYHITVMGYPTDTVPKTFANLVCPQENETPLYYSTTHGVRDERKDATKNGIYPRAQQ